MSAPAAGPNPLAEEEQLMDTSKMSTFARLMYKGGEMAIGHIKLGLTNGSLIPRAACYQDESGSWIYNFEFRTPDREEPVFVAEGNDAGPEIAGGFPLHITRFPPKMRVPVNPIVREENLLVFHQPAPSEDDAQHRIRVVMKPLGDDGDSIDLETVAPAGSLARMTLL